MRSALAWRNEMLERLEMDVQVKFLKDPCCEFMK